MIDRGWRGAVCNQPCPDALSCVRAGGCAWFAPVDEFAAALRDAQRKEDDKGTPKRLSPTENATR